MFQTQLRGNDDWRANCLIWHWILDWIGAQLGKTNYWDWVDCDDLSLSLFILGGWMINWQIRIENRANRKCTQRTNGMTPSIPFYMEKKWNPMETKRKTHTNDKILYINRFATGFGTRFDLKRKRTTRKFKKKQINQTKPKHPIQWNKRKRDFSFESSFKL